MPTGHHSRRSSSCDLDFTSHRIATGDLSELEYDELSYEEIEIEDWDGEADIDDDLYSYEEFEEYDEDDDAATFVTIEDEGDFGALYTIYEVDNEDVFDDDDGEVLCDVPPTPGRTAIKAAESSNDATAVISPSTAQHRSQDSSSKAIENMSPTSVIPTTSSLAPPPAPQLPPCHDTGSCDDSNNATPKSANQRKKCQGHKNSTSCCDDNTTTPPAPPLFTSRDFRSQATHQPSTAAARAVRRRSLDSESFADASVMRRTYADDSPHSYLLMCLQDQRGSSAARGTYLRRGSLDSNRGGINRVMPVVC